MPESIDGTERLRRNRDTVARNGFHYIFSPTSGCFHRNDCCRGLSAAVIQGTVYYRTAAEKRRPCKICHPEPEEETPKCEQSENGVGGQLPVVTSPDSDDLIRVRLLGGKVELIKRKDILGACHNLTHPGKLTKKLMEKHGCIPKQCPFFKRNEEAPYWVALERKKSEKARIKQARKKTARDAAMKLEDLKKKFQGYFDLLGHPVRVIRIEQLKQNVFRIFYVSDRKFPDGSLYPDFYDIVQENDPAYRVVLRHIKDIDGHFVTREEYQRRFG